MTTSTYLPSSSSELSWSIEAGSRRCEVRSTTVADGDFAVRRPAEELDRLRRRVVDLEWSWVRQVHGTEVIHVTAPGQGVGHEADGLLTSIPGCALAVTTADCAPVVLVGTDAVAIVHAGWRGALAGIVEIAADQLRALDAEPVASILGPCIGPAHYEFGAEELQAMIDRFGREVVAHTLEDRPALDMTAVVAQACALAGWPRPSRPVCTSDEQFFSHRTRGDLGRQTTVAWLEPR